MAGISIAIVAPAPVPPAFGGAERLWWGLYEYLNHSTPHIAELIKVPAPERTFDEVVVAYERFAVLDLRAYDIVISGKYPAWMVDHPDHRVYMLHPLRGLYDAYARFGLAEQPDTGCAAVAELLDVLYANEGRREALPEVFARLRALSSDAAAPTSELQLRSPLLRRAVHWLDRVGLHPSRVRQFATMSRTVRDRQGYFPVGVEVRVAPPMTPLAPLLRPGRDRGYVLVPGRLDRPKRVDLLIRAALTANRTVELMVAGTGPHEEELRELAAGDPRIRFAGRVSDAELAELYAEARAVAFAPSDGGLRLRRAGGDARRQARLDHRRRRWTDRTCAERCDGLGGVS
jgi:glycosyltransferase involved in cell wall biosynthesis